MTGNSPIGRSYPLFSPKDFNIIVKVATDTDAVDKEPAARQQHHQTCKKRIATNYHD
jgi:hypothetical protein